MQFSKEIRVLKETINNYQIYKDVHVKLRTKGI